MQSVFPGLSAAPNVHPLFVHFPIALLLTALLFWAIALFRGSGDAWRLGRWLLYLGTLGALVAVTTGFVATERMGHEMPGHDLVHLHRNFMLATTALAVVTAALAFVWRRSSSRAARWVQLGLLSITAVVMVLGTDRGANLVFHYGIGSAGEAPPSEAAEGHDGGHTHDEGHAHQE